MNWFRGRVPKEAVSGAHYKSAANYAQTIGYLNGTVWITADRMIFQASSLLPRPRGFRIALDTIVDMRDRGGWRKLAYFPWWSIVRVTTSAGDIVDLQVPSSAALLDAYRTVPPPPPSVNLANTIT